MSLAEQQINAVLFSSLSIATYIILLIVLFLLILNTLVKQQEVFQVLAFRIALMHCFFPLPAYYRNRNYNLTRPRRHGPF